MLGNTPTQPVDFFLERAKSFAFCVKVQHEDGTPFDLTGASIRCAIARPRRLGGGLALLHSAEDVGVEGVRQFQYQAVELDLTPGEYSHDITLLTAENYTVPLAKGTITIGSNTDTIDNNIYDFSDPDQWLTFTIKNSATIKTVVKNSLGLGSVWVGGGPSTLAAPMLEAIQDAVASMLVAGDNVDLEYSDAAGTLVISSTGGGGGGGGSFTGYNPLYALVYEA